MNRPDHEDPQLIDETCSETWYIDRPLPARQVQLRFVTFHN